jgi:hypothetical protein
VVLVVSPLENVDVDVDVGAVEVEVARLRMCRIIICSLPVKLPLIIQIILMVVQMHPLVARKKANLSV